MSCCSSGSCGTGCGGCKAVKIIVTLLLTATTLATLLGVWKTHSTPSGWMFGTMEGSLAILAFVLSVTIWVKMVKCLCPCSKGGMCPGCGQDPCVCRK